MIKRKVIPILVAIVLVASLAGCANWQSNMTKGYQAGGVIGKTYYSVAKGGCDKGSIPADKCAMLQKINNDARRVYLQAGDALILAIEVDDSVQREKLLVEYNTLMVQFNKVLLDFVTLLRDLKVL